MATLPGKPSELGRWGEIHGEGLWLLIICLLVLRVMNRSDWVHDLGFMLWPLVCWLWVYICPHLIRLI